MPKPADPRRPWRPVGLGGREVGETEPHLGAGVGSVPRRHRGQPEPLAPGATTPGSYSGRSSCAPCARPSVRDGVDRGPSKEGIVVAVEGCVSVLDAGWVAVDHHHRIDRFLRHEDTGGGGWGTKRVGADHVAGDVPGGQPVAGLMGFPVDVPWAEEYPRRRSIPTTAARSLVPGNRVKPEGLRHQDRVAVDRPPRPRGGAGWWRSASYTPHAARVRAGESRSGHYSRRTIRGSLVGRDFTRSPGRRPAPSRPRPLTPPSHPVRLDRPGVSQRLPEEAAKA